MATALVATPPINRMQSTASRMENVSILEALATSKDGIYEIPLLPENEVFPISVVSEITTEGWAQALTIIHLPLTATWEAVQKSLAVASLSWQTVDWGLEADAGGAQGRWLFQAIRDGKPEKEWKELGTEKEWRGSKKCVVEGEGKVKLVVWHEVVHAEMSARKTWYDANENEDLVDFHNACEMNVALSLPDLEVKEENGIEKRRRLSGEGDG